MQPSDLPPQPTEPPMPAGSVVSPSSNIPGAPQPGRPMPAPANVKPPKKQRWWVWLLTILILAGAAGGGYYYYKHYYHKAKPVVEAPAKRDVALIRFATADGPVNVFYPSKNTIDVSGLEEVNDQVFEGLVGWQGGTKLVPLLATSWTNPDDSTWVFTLRQNVKFHTGHTLTATDVKYSLDNFKDTTYADEFGTTIKTVTVVSPTQVKIATDGPDPLLLNRLANLYIIDSKNTKPDDPVNGTGPYVVKPGTDPVKDNVTDLVAYDSYWGGHVFTRELQFSEITTEADQVAALKNNKIDIFDIFTDQASIKELQTAGVKMLPQQSLIVDMMALNTLKAGSPLGNLKFRQALSLGIDRKAIITAAGVNGTPTGQYMVSVVPGYVPKLTAPTQDVTQAKALITQSGVKSPTLTLSYGADSSNQAAMVEFQKECAAIGVTIKLDPITDLDALVKKYSDGKTDMFFFGNSSVLLDASDILTAFQYPGVYDNTTVDKLLTQANQTLDGAKRLALLQQAAEALDTDAAGIPLYTRSQYIAQTNKTYNLTVDIPAIDAGIYFWKVYQQ